jgi:mono/diheme cytochrome c family protein
MSMKSAFFFGLVLLSTGCAEKDDEDIGTADDPATACNEANEACDASNCDGEGEEMLPGSDCQACHTEGNLGEDDEEENWFTVSGTVFEDEDGTAGSDGVTIRLTDADGAVHELTSNRVGNFYSSLPISFPVQAEVERNGEIVAMSDEAGTGACSSCHQCDASTGAKIYAP